MIRAANSYFKVTFKGVNGTEDAYIGTNDLVAVPNELEYKWILSNTEKDNIIKAINDTQASEAVISIGSKSIDLTFPQISNITDAELMGGMSAVVNVSANSKINSGKYDATLRMTQDAAGNNFDLAFTPYVPPYVPPTPAQENVSIPIEIGAGEKKITVNINAARALDTDGLEKETLKLDEDTSKKIVANAVETKSNEAYVVLPTDSRYYNDKIDIQLPKEAMIDLSSSNISLNIGKGKADLKLPSQTFAALNGKDAEIKIKDLTDSSKLAETRSLILQLTSGGQIVSAPVSIEANFSGRAKITLPIDVSMFTNKDDLNKYLSSLAVLVQHSNGENVVDNGTIVYGSNGNPIGISIWVDKFSDFTLVQFPEGYFKGKTTVIKDKVNADKEWNFNFTKAADPATVTPENIYVTDSKGNKINVKVSCESEKVIKVSPVNSYKSGESYYIYVSKNVTSTAKEPLSEDLRYEFIVK